jgi:hypothetical protein
MNAFDWNEFLKLAIELSKRTDEASLRTAISRAYYSAYNTAARRPAVVQYRFSDDGSSHDQLWALYERNADDNCKRLAMLGGRMKRKRVQADYRSLYPRVAEELIGVLEDAQECAAIMASLNPKYPEPVARSWSR